MWGKLNLLCHQNGLPPVSARKSTRTLTGVKSTDLQQSTRWPLDTHVATPVMPGDWPMGGRPGPGRRCCVHCALISDVSIALIWSSATPGPLKVTPHQLNSPYLLRVTPGSESITSPSSALIPIPKHSTSQTGVSKTWTIWDTEFVSPKREVLFRLSRGTSG